MNLFEKLLIVIIDFFDNAKTMSARNKAVAMSSNKQYPKLTQEEFEKIIDDLTRSVCMNNLPFLQRQGVVTKEDLQTHFNAYYNRAIILLYERISLVADKYGKKEELREILESYGDNVSLFNDHIPDFKGYLKDACEYVQKKMQMS